MAETLSFPYETSILIMGAGCLTDSFSHRDFIFNIFTMRTRVMRVRFFICPLSHIHGFADARIKEKGHIIKTNHMAYGVVGVAESIARTNSFFKILNMTKELFII